MSNNLKDILSNLNKDIEQDKLLEYLNNQLPQEEQHAVESSLNDDPFMSDALEGLAGMQDRAQLQPVLQQLNAQLNKQIKKSKVRKHKRRIPEQSWIYFAVILMLVLLIFTYLVMKKL